MSVSRLRHSIVIVALTAIGAALAMLCYQCGEREPVIEPSAEVKGIDVSSHNGVIDFEAAKSDGVEFAMIKATEGSTFKDSAFLRNHRLAREAGIKVGAYHFFRFETDGTLQAINFLNSVRGKALDLPLVIDIEEWGNPHPCPTTEIVERLRAMAEYLQSYGYSVMLYTNRDGYARFVKGRLDDFPLWICSFTDPPLDKSDRQWTLWQYSHHGNVKGIQSEVDRNAYAGTRADFNAWLDTITMPAQY